MNKTPTPITFTLAEIWELRRALDLIANEDRSAGVNMGRAEVRAKKSALKKLNTATGWRDPFKGAGSVSVFDILKRMDDPK